MEKEKMKDVGYALLKGTIGGLPFVGAPASELLSVLIAPPLEKRREELLNGIGERLLHLEQSGRVDLDKLRENQFFLDVVLQACQNALRTSDSEKITYYRNIIEHTALGDAPDKVLSQVYLNSVDRYTSLHVKILVLFDDPIQLFKTKQLDQIVLKRGSLSAIAYTAYPELAGRRGLYDLIFSELQRDGMLGSDTPQNIMTPGAPLQGIVTEFGKDFLRFITCDE